MLTLKLQSFQVAYNMLGGRVKGRSKRLLVNFKHLIIYLMEKEANGIDSQAWKNVI